MTLDEIRYLIQSFSEALRENVPGLFGIYQIEVSLHSFPEIGYRVELFWNAGTFVSSEAQVKDLRRNLGSYPLDTYELKDFFNTTERVAGTFDRTEWLSRWKRSIEREWMLRNIGI